MNCGTKMKYPYQSMYYQNNKFAFSPVYFMPEKYESLGNLLRIEIWYENDTISLGRFIDGQKSGIWKYNIPGSNPFAVNWTIFKSDSNQLSISIPSDWKIKDFEFPGGIGVETYGKISSDSLAALLYHHSEKFSNRDDYLIFIDGVMEEYKQDNLIDSLSRTSIKVNNRVSVDILEYILLYKNDYQFVLNMLVWNNGELYEAGLSIYSQIDESTKIKYYVYLMDMVRSMKYNRLLIFPYSETLEVIDYQ